MCENTELYSGMKRKYQNDPFFNKIVDVMADLILDGLITKNNLQEASILACRIADSQGAALDRYKQLQEDEKDV